MPRKRAGGWREQHSARGRAHPRRATTLVELLVVVAFIGALLGFAVVRIVRLRDAAAARTAATEVEQALGLARETAVAWRTTAAVRIDTQRARLELRRGAVLLRARDLGAEYGVVLGTSRDSVVYDARGLGRGAANATIVVRRGVAVDSVVVSRLGRVRR